MKKYLIIFLSILFILQLPVRVFATTYTYDDLGRLLKVVNDSGSSINYTYDARGNITNIKTENPLAYLNASLDTTNKIATLTYTEYIINNYDSLSELKSAITFAGDGITFAALGVDDTIAISGKSLIVVFNSALSGNTNKIKITSNSLKNEAGVVLDADTITEALQTTNITLPTPTPTQTKAFVTRFYQLCLGREPDAGGLTYWTDSLLSGSLSGADLSNQLVFSEEFRNRNVTNDECITIMYKSFFGRDPDAGGKDYWMSVFDSGMSRYYILAGFVNSEEFRNICNTYGITVGSLAITAPVDKYPQITQFVTRFYKLCLNRMPDVAGLDHWVVQLQTQNLAGANVAHDIVTSEEFTNRGTTNDEFVEIMYKAFFDRTSEASGKAYWTGRLAAGTSRYTVLAGFVNSQEFTNICSTYSINRGNM